MTEQSEILLGGNDPPPFQPVNGGSSAPLLIICDHASNKLPESVNGLGLPDAEMDWHIAWDIGAAAITRALVARLDAAAVLTSYSRLLIDANRRRGEPESIPKISDGTVIPDNASMSLAAAHARTKQFFWPYHHAINDQLTRLHALGRVPAVYSVHTFTPHMEDESRPWHIGVLWKRDDRMVASLLESLPRLNTKLTVGDSLPYTGTQIAYSLNLHAGLAGFPHVAVEIRQDLTARGVETEKWAELLAASLSEIMTIPGLHSAEYY
ncbi:MAG: N-formylglutamate amidohydrolase [Pseudomonadota bacterium]|nr:N-formylglutamate amidohydrolase [Pseudomonadota bacterium]